MNMVLKQSKIGLRIMFIMAGLILVVGGVIYVKITGQNNNALLKDIPIDEIVFNDKDWAYYLLDIIEKGPSLLSRDEIINMDPPPINSSKETRAELEELHRLAEFKRSPKTIAMIELEHKATTPNTLFVIHDLLIEKNNEKTIALLDQINLDHGYYILERKKHFARPRPDALDPTLKTVIKNPPHAAYPSGHAAQSYMVALVLSDLDPDNAERYKQLALDIAHRREIAGVHYVSDSEVGRKLAVDILAKLKKFPKIQEMWTAAKESYVKPSIGE